MKVKSQTPISRYQRFEGQMLLWKDLIENKKNNEIFIAGDFNMQEGDTNHTKMLKLINEIFHQNNLTKINSAPTRLNRCIDHIHTSRSDKLQNFYQIDSTSSDHSLLVYIRRMNIELCEPTMILTRDMNKQTKIS